MYNIYICVLCINIIKYRSFEVNIRYLLRLKKKINTQTINKITNDKNNLDQYINIDTIGRQKRDSYFGVVGNI